MRVIGLVALLLGIMAFLYPQFHEYAPGFIRLKGQEPLLIGGLLVAVGALTLAIYRSS